MRQFQGDYTNKLKFFVMPRLFTAIKIPNKIASLLELRQVGIANARFIDKNDFHITLCFIGDIDEILAQQITHVFEKIKFGEPFELEIDRLDVFGHKKPRALIANIKQNEALTQLRNTLLHKLQLLGIEIEARKFTPHITLARFSYYRANSKREQKNKSDEIANYLAINNFTKPLSFTVDNYCVFSAKPSIGGGPYIIEQCYYLT